MLSSTEEARVEELIAEAEKILGASETANAYLERKDDVTSEMILAVADFFRRKGFKVKVGAADDNVRVTRW